MIDSFLLFIDSKIKKHDKPTDPSNLGGRLQDLGYRVIKTTDPSAVGSFIQQVDALIICSSAEEIENLAKNCLVHRSLPLIWWFHGDSQDHSSWQLEVDIDSMLCPTMADSEIHWSLHLCSNRYVRRIQWQKERELLLTKLEERKHIEKAKEILCEIKNISESEAYEFIRKQAMDERKRIVDVALSIMNAYRLLISNKADGNR